MPGALLDNGGPALHKVLYSYLKGATFIVEESVCNVLLSNSWMNGYRASSPCLGLVWWENTVVNSSKVTAFQTKGWKPK